MEASYVASAFVDAINSHDVEALSLLMTDDHVFVNSCGTRIEDFHTMRVMWRETFRWSPDYHIHVHRMVVEDDFVVLIGTTSGIDSNHAFCGIPSVWTAQIEGSCVREWRVYSASLVEEQVQCN